MDWPLWAVLVATAPIIVLAVLVLRGRALTPVAWLAAGLAGVAAVTVFGLDGLELGVGVLRGIWTGVWILLIVLPALLLFEVLDRSGALDRMADAAGVLAPTQGRALLLLAFVLPSFLQGAAGFGAPIAMAAPMLVRRGMAPAMAVAACVVGYQWSVTFGSMGASYFMAEATARLSEAEAGSFALRAGIVLAVNAVVSGLLVLTRAPRQRGDRRRAVALGAIMGVTLLAVVSIQPAIGSTAAGLAGLFACWWLLPERGAARPAIRPVAIAALPYIALTITAAIGFALPPVRAAFERLPELAPVLPGSSAAFGFSTPDLAATPVFRPLLHPLPYLLIAITVAVVVYRRHGWWTPGTGRQAVASWLTRCRKVGASILGLTVLAAVLTEAGMVAAIATSLADGLGSAFLAVSIPIGTLGTMLTSSTTASNALFSGLQAEVAVSIGLLPAVMLAAQTAGGNIGSALSPGVIAVGTSATGASGDEGSVLRRNLGAAGILTLAALGTVLVQVWLLGLGG